MLPGQQQGQFRGPTTLPYNGAGLAQQQHQMGEEGSSDASDEDEGFEAGSSKGDNGSDNNRLRRMTFIETLYNMVHTPENEQAIGFAADGVSLEVRNTIFFSTNVLPKHFKHRNVSSFIRQLNNYGFRTVPSVKGVFQTFVHDNFLKDRRDLIKFITRRTTHVVKKKKTLFEQVTELKQREAERKQRLEEVERADTQKSLYITDLENRNRMLLEEREALVMENQRLMLMLSAQATKDLNASHHQQQQYSQQGNRGYGSASAYGSASSSHATMPPPPPSYSTSTQQGWAQQPSSLFEPVSGPSRTHHDLNLASPDPSGQYGGATGDAFDWFNKLN